jgi:hypothetical protein
MICNRRELAIHAPPLRRYALLVEAPVCFENYFPQYLDILPK